MKKRIQLFLIVLLLGSVTFGFAQKPTATAQKKTLEKPYHPEDDAQAKINSLLVQAKKQKKYVFLQAGGNWCSWCLLFHDFVKNTPEVKKVVDSHFLYYHLNYSKDQPNTAVFQKYAPGSEKLGYPFFIILNAEGQVVTIHESGSFEQGKGYSKEKVLSFLKENSPKK